MRTSRSKSALWGGAGRGRGRHRSDATGGVAAGAAAGQYAAEAGHGRCAGPGPSCPRPSADTGRGYMICAAPDGMGQSDMVPSSADGMITPI